MDIEVEPKALKRRLIGPFKIVKMYGPSAAELELLKAMLAHPFFHVFLAPVAQECFNPRRNPADQDPVAEQEYTIAGILDHMEENQICYFVVKWTEGPRRGNLRVTSLVGRRLYNGI